MAGPDILRKAYQRNQKALKLRPSLGKKTVSTKVRLYNGTTCEVEHKHWKFKVDIGIDEGGNDAGPGPGILERGALGSCMAIGYSQQAALMNVPIDHLEIEVESDFDARGMLAIDDRPPGFEALRIKVYIESPASKEEVQKVIEKAEKHSPVLDDFKRAIPVKREITFVSENEKK